jgi:signal transduction histidine kinase
MLSHIPISSSTQEAREEASLSTHKRIAGTGTMADLVRSHNWAATPLGPIASWPDALISSVSIILSCQFPSVLLWGPQMIQFYNDGYRPLMTDKHPTALGQSARDCWKEAWHLIGSQWEAVLSHGQTVFQEEVLVPVLRNGILHDIYWTYSYSPVYGPQGAIDGILIVCLDVTHRRLAQAALLQSEKLAAVGRLASSIAHEINNPLESVMNLIYLARQYATDPDAQKFLEIADQEIRRVSIIANQTLRFHKQLSNPQAIGCSDLFQTVLSIYEGRLKNFSITVEKRKRAQQPITCFEGDIRQVLNNLVANAIDAMPFGGRLLLRSRESTHWPTGRRGLTLTIADTGTGIPPEIQKDIFNPFFTTKGISGTGLGLWVSQEIVERHNGVLTVHSSQNLHSNSHHPQRSGTVFTLFLPFEATIRHHSLPK